MIDFCRESTLNMEEKGVFDHQATIKHPTLSQRKIKE